MLRGELLGDGLHAPLALGAETFARRPAHPARRGDRVRSGKIRRAPCAGGEASERVRAPAEQRVASIGVIERRSGDRFHARPVGIGPRADGGALLEHRALGGAQIVVRDACGDEEAVWRGTLSSIRSRIPKSEKLSPCVVSYVVPEA